MPDALLPLTEATPATRLDALVHFYEHLSPDSLADLGQHYASEARFRDPFNDVTGLSAIGQIFVHMFATLHAPRFVVHQRQCDGTQGFLTWEFRFRFKSYQPDTEQVIQGASYLQFDAHGRVLQHRDYWDAAQELYEKLPLLGSLMRWLRARLRAR